MPKKGRTKRGKSAKSRPHQGYVKATRRRWVKVDIDDYPDLARYALREGARTPYKPRREATQRKGRTKRRKRWMDSEIAESRLRAARRRSYRARKEFRLNPSQAANKKKKSTQRALYRAKRTAARYKAPQPPRRYSKKFAQKALDAAKRADAKRMAAAARKSWAYKAATYRHRPP